LLTSSVWWRTFQTMQRLKLSVENAYR
jgi:hypothetical protein